MNYYELREHVAAIIPRMTQLSEKKKKASAVKEKGRKSNYKEFKLQKKEWVKQERLLNVEEINSFVEISCRAAACPMPLNMDVWDGLICPFNCKYCFANAFRASLYTAFFDNSKTMGLRHCDPEKYKTELDKLMKLRGKDPHTINNSVAKAIAMEMPIRLGIRFEDFLKEEEELGISLEMMNYLSSHGYPVMVNTKSDLIGTDAYVQALAMNEGGSAVHMTLISCNEKLLANLEPGAPTYKQRLQAMENLTSAGVRVVARIEPFLPFINDQKDEVDRYIKDLKRIGVSHITFDTYSYTAKNPGIKQTFLNAGYDWDRIILVGCDSQSLGSLMLGKFMELFRDEGFKCSTFDMGNVPTNDDPVCCETGDVFKEGFNYGCSVYACRYIVRKKGPVSWRQFRRWVNNKGGFLSPMLEREAHMLWNFEGNEAYSHAWSAGIVPAGEDEHGMLWKYKPELDHRQDLLEGLL